MTLIDLVGVVKFELKYEESFFYSSLVILVKHFTPRVFETTEFLLLLVFFLSSILVPALSVPTLSSGLVLSGEK